MFDALEMRTKADESYDNIPVEYADSIIEISKGIEDNADKGLDTFAVAVKASNKGSTFEEQVEDTCNIAENICLYFINKGFSVLCNYSGDNRVNLLICWNVSNICNIDRILKRCCEYAVKYSRENTFTVYNTELNTMSPEEFNARGIVTKIE
jgi:hypothetical protein